MLLAFFKNNDIIYSNCKMHLVSQFLFSRFEIIQGYFVGYSHCGLCFSLMIGPFENCCRIFEIMVQSILSVKCISSYGFHSFMIFIMYSNCKMRLLLKLSFNRFKIIQVSFKALKHNDLCLV